MQPEPPPRVEWWQRRPPVLWPVPVAEARAFFAADWSLLGGRVIVGGAQRGEWLYDMRAASWPHMRDGQEVLAVLPEMDWYRQQRDPTVPIVPHAAPADSVYVEVPTPVAADAAPVPADQSDMAVDDRAVNLLTTPEQPPVRWPRPASQEPHLTGSRCTLVELHELTCEWRVLGEPRRDRVPRLNLAAGLEDCDTVGSPSIVIPVCPEDQWYAWLDGHPPETRTLVEPSLLYLE